VRRRDECPFAVKVIEKHTLAGDPKQRQAVLTQLRKEVKILKLLDHPNIIHYYVSVVRQFFFSLDLLFFSSPCIAPSPCARFLG